jgi:CheY-like chemotaxis protein/HD-like signal output (HDOD) protein
MRGVLARGNHRFAAVSSMGEAWGFIQRNVAVDLVFLELKLEGESGLGLLQRLRGDVFLKLMPVVIYAAAGDRESVRETMQLKVQNFLVKPYRDDYILAEVGKALANPWRNQHFEEEKSFCAMTGYTPDTLRDALRALHAALQGMTAPLLDFAKSENLPGVTSMIEETATKAESAGAWGIVECLNDLKALAEQSLWPAFGDMLAELGFAERLLFTHLNPSVVPEDFVTPEERNKAEEERQRAVWFNAPLENRCPVVAWPQIQQELDALKGFPVVDSVAAAFQMTATGHPSSLAPLMDLAEKDPGLSAQLIVTANQVRKAGSDADPEPVENPRLCVGLLGENKLAAMAGSLVRVEERFMDIPPCSWTSFWMFQLGVARMALYTCRYLELNSLESRAYAAGLMHELGKLLFVRLHPMGFQAAVDFARRESVPMSVAEQTFIGCTSAEMGAHFATTHGFPPSYAYVMRWADAPEKAEGDPVLVAIIALARELCRQNRVGWSGDPVVGVRPMAETPAWEILSSRVFPSFNLHKFESEVHAECRQLKRELLGQANLPQV